MKYTKIAIIAKVIITLKIVISNNIKLNRNTLMSPIRAHIRLDLNYLMTKKKLQCLFNRLFTYN